MYTLSSAKQTHWSWCPRSHPVIQMQDWSNDFEDNSGQKYFEDKFKESPGRLHSPGLSAPPQLATSQRFSSPKHTESRKISSSPTCRWDLGRGLRESGCDDDRNGKNGIGNNPWTSDTQQRWLDILPPPPAHWTIHCEYFRSEINNWTIHYKLIMARQNLLQLLCAYWPPTVPCNRKWKFSSPQEKCVGVRDAIASKTQNSFLNCVVEPVKKWEYLSEFLKFCWR